MSDVPPPRKAPYVMSETPGKKAWCACGRTAKAPFCDGSHKGTGMGPVVVEITEEKKVAWCGCGKAGTAPFCDGTHKSL